MRHGICFICLSHGLGATRVSNLSSQSRRWVQGWLLLLAHLPTHPEVTAGWTGRRNSEDMPLGTWDRPCTVASGRGRSSTKIIARDVFRPYLGAIEESAQNLPRRPLR